MGIGNSLGLKRTTQTMGTISLREDPIVLTDLGQVPGNPSAQEFLYYQGRTQRYQQAEKEINRNIIHMTNTLEMKLMSSRNPSQ